MAMTGRKKQEFLDKKREIEEETIKSTEESLRILRETEKCGVTTAEELSRQGEQLKKIDGQLDDINGMLTTSQKHIKGMKSMFGGFKNLFGKQDKSESDITPNKNDTENLKPKIQSNGLQQSNNYEPSTVKSQQQQPQVDVASDFDSRLNANMGEMSKSISMLKSIATDMGQEIENQNELIDEITRKTEQADETIQQQNKQVRKLLGK